MFSANFDQRSLAVIAQMYQFSTFLEPEVATAMKKASGLLTQAAQSNTETAFQNPTGQLRDSIIPVLESPWEVQVGVKVPYGARLEFGFGPNGSEATDSLGRRFHNPAEPYLTPAFNNNQQQVLQSLDQAILVALERIGGNH